MFTGILPSFHAMSDLVVGLIGVAAEKRDEIEAVAADTFDGSPPRFISPGEGMERSAVIGAADVLLTFNLDVSDLEDMRGLRLVHALNAGVDAYPRAGLAERDIPLTNSSGVHAKPIGQQVLGYLLVFERRIHEGMRQRRAGEWDPYEGGELGDRRLGIVGVGAIGTKVAEYAASFDMSTTGITRTPAAAPAVLDACYPPRSLHDVLPAIEYLVLACPLTPETRGMIGEAELAELPAEAVVVNIARGEIIDESALVAALRKDEIRGAALDVFREEPLPADSPLREFESVIMTPHMAGSTPRYLERAIPIFAENLERLEDGRPLRNRVV